MPCVPTPAARPEAAALALDGRAQFERIDRRRGVGPAPRCRHRLPPRLAAQRRHRRMAAVGDRTGARWLRARSSRISMRPPSGVAAAPAAPSSRSACASTLGSPVTLALLDIDVGVQRARRALRSARAGRRSMPASSTARLTGWRASSPLQALEFALLALQVPQLRVQASRASSVVVAAALDDAALVHARRSGRR